MVQIAIPGVEQAAVRGTEWGNEEQERGCNHESGGDNGRSVGSAPVSSEQLFSRAVYRDENRNRKANQNAKRLADGSRKAGLQIRYSQKY